jgi:hypothetical protein
MNWVFRPTSNNSISQSTASDGKVIFSFKTRLNFSGEEGENVVIMGSKEEGSYFEYTSQILSVENKILDDQKLKIFTVTLSQHELIKTPNKLDDLLYSLHKVYNYDRPYIHFNRVYSRLTKDDFEVIANGKLFVARTAFGKLVNALHQKHRIAFVQMLIERNPSIYFTSRKYDEVFDLLKEYIETRILIFTEFLSGAWNNFQKINPDSNNQIAFAESSESRRDLISQQIDSINKMNELNAQNKFYLRLESVEIEFRDTERVFIRKFSKKPLPISMK